MACWFAYRGHAVCTGAAVIGGKHLASRISERTVWSHSLDNIYVLDLQHIPNLTGGQGFSHWDCYNLQSPSINANPHLHVSMMSTFNLKSLKGPLRPNQKGSTTWMKILYSILLDRTMSYKCDGNIWITHWPWICQEGRVTQVLPLFMSF